MRLGYVVFAITLAGCAHGPVFHPSKDGSPTPPAIVDPKPDAVLVNIRPPITIALAPGTDSAHLEICRNQSCTDVAASFDTIGNRGVPATDFQTGVYWLRASGRSGDRVGQPGPAQKLVLEPRGHAKSLHFVIDGPREDRATLEQLAVLSEKLLAFYCDYFKLAMPDLPFTETFFVTPEGFQVAIRHDESENIRAHHAGFTNGAHFFGRWEGRSGRALVDGPGFLEFLVAHEMVHLMQNQLDNRLNAQQPGWLVESEADFVAELAIASAYGLPLASVVRHVGREAGAKRALRESYLIPVSKFVYASHDMWKAENAQTTGLFYSEGLALLHMLNTQPDRLHDFLRDLWHSSFNNELSIQRKLTALFGDSKTLDAKLRAWLAVSPSSLFDRIDLDERLVADDVFYFETKPKGYGTAIAEVHPDAARIVADLEPTKGTQFWQLRFGISKDSSYGARVRADGTVELLRFGKSLPRTLAKQSVALEPRTELAVVFDAKTAVVSLGGKEILRAALPEPPKGRAGLGLRDGQLTLRGWKVTAAEVPPPVAEPTPSTQ